MTLPHPTPTTLEDMQSNIAARVNACVTHANMQLAINLAQPNISFNQRGKIAGCARLQTNSLKFNPVLLVDNYAAFMSEVVPHEVCHLLAYNLYGRVKPHGKEWRRLMSQLFGLTGQTYHKMDVTKVSGKTFPYVCECGQIELSIRRHNKVLRQQQRYICRQCSEILQPI
ncbi:SprT family zinc-dependent metalloprotease [Paraglaciecola sp. L1A13]|uniref:SprT family zinc-dependent metalloprotease n=1 Tax=Paraglaciecola sp. L1A13 TaxID=2686359 RepID=UPI001E34CBDA|nr:SprT family zinc-dependent metalloprotease [Paraglaciecola sp. L1A13]